MNKRIISVAISAALVLTPVNVAFNVYAQDEKKQEVNKDNENLNLTLNDAIKIATENNYILKGLEVDLKATDLSLDRAKHNERKINKGQDKLDDGRDMLSKLKGSKNQLNGAYNHIKGALNSGYTIDQIAQMPNGKQGLEALKQAGINPTSSDDFDTQYTKSVKYGETKLSSGEQSFSSAIGDANSVIAQKLNIDVERVLAVDSTTELMTTMADLQNEVTKDGYLIAQKKIGLLTRQKYYEVIKTEKIENLKKIALDRATAQYNMAKDAYEAGMKAKDDLLLAQAQVNLMNVDYRKSCMNRKNAEIELKKVMNVDLNKNINLVQDFTTTKVEVNLEQGLKQGSEKRIEIRKAQAQYLVDKLNLELTSSQYPENTYQYKESKIKMEKSKVAIDSAGKDVEASIMQSYEAVEATADMLAYTKGVVENAKESLEIAEYRYKEGYGFETTVIKNSNLQDVAGTMVEVIAAQERLADIEEKVIEVIFSYNLARDKYLNDIGSY
ncbi:MAG: TolC family protein [Tepidibacter sp.]|jgi:outer membrane protein TolC|uniref:TolC family protein n=1 Tax=Tepidibacter sp. TaxID=2529387 RepID=UPI0025F848E1|nr:TolC family protein [Tepidibacter sp.]MCT4507694.1 TolC family protein [Tepidibacter sp.]